MAKKVIGIILTVLGGISILMALIFGLVFGGIGTAMNGVSDSVSDNSQDSNITTCDGVVVDVGDSKTTVEYEVDGNLYAVDLNMSTSAYPVGSRVTVYYNETKPEECSIPEIAGSIGGVFSGVGIGLFIFFAVIGIVELIVGILLIRSSAKGKNAGGETPVNNV